MHTENFCQNHKYSLFDSYAVIILNITINSFKFDTLMKVCTLHRHTKFKIRIFNISQLSFFTFISITSEIFVLETSSFTHMYIHVICICSLIVWTIL